MRSFLLVCSLTFILPASAVEKAEQRAKTLAPLLEPSTFGIIRVDLGRLDPGEVSKTMTKYLDKQLGELAKVPEMVKQLTQLWKTLEAQDFYAVLSMANILDNEAPRMIVIFKDEKAAKNALPIVERLPMFRQFKLISKGNALIGAGKKSLQRLNEARPTPHPELAKALSVSSSPVQGILYTGSDLVRRSLEENVESLPPEIGGGSIKVVSRGLRWGVISLDAPPKMKLNITLQTRDAKTAKTLESMVEKAVAFIIKKEKPNRHFKGIEELMQKLIPKVKGDQLVVSVDEKDALGPISEMLKKARGAVGRQLVINTMKQLGLAMHNYADSFGKGFPPSYSMKGKKKLLSWRVLILPFIEHDNLYRQFHLDEPWDSEHNKKLIQAMPKLYQPMDRPDLGKLGKTTYVLPVHKESAHPPGKQVKIQDIKDGTSNTIMIVEINPKDAVIWTKPDDLEISKQNPLAKLFMHDDKGFVVSICDGSVRFISKSIDPKTVWALFTREGGEVVNIP